MSHLFQLGQFTLHSGKESSFKIECDALTFEDWKTIAHIIGSTFSFKEVEGIPTGGLILENLLKPYRRETGTYSLLIVDDVFTTGGSMEKHRNKRSDVHGVVLFSRVPEKMMPYWIDAIFSMNISA